MFWRREQTRACYGHWFTSPLLMQTEMSQLAARAIYAVFNLFPFEREPANDRDNLRW